MGFKFDRKKMRKKGSKKEQKPRSKICCPPLPRQPYTWLLLIMAREDNVGERHVFYSVTEDRYYVRFVPELHNKYVACCYGGWMVLNDKSTSQFSILNISTMEKLQLPAFHKFIYPLDDSYDAPPNCILSSPVMDRNCRIIFFDTFVRKFKSCYLGDSEFIERELVYNDDDDGGVIINLINFRGKLYALACFSYDLIAADFLDPDLHFEQVVSGKSLERIQCPRKCHGLEEKYLVESCEDLLLIVIGSDSCFDEISEVFIFRADFSSREWVEHETLGDRAIFLDSVNTFSSPASAFGLKSNALYWIGGIPLGCCTLPSPRHLYVYDVQDKSVSISLPCPIVGGTHSLLSWFSLPITTTKEDKPKYTTTSLLFEPVETNFNRNKTINLQPRKTKNKEEIVEIGSSLWADLPNDLLIEIFLRLFAGDRVAFRLACRSWYSISPPSMTSQQKLILPLKESKSDIFSSPFLMCPDKKACHPIYNELYSMDYFPDLPEANIRAARDGWLLMDELSFDLYFYNPFTKAKITLPDSDAISFMLIHFSAPPTSTDFLVVAVATMYDKSLCICCMKSIDEGWTYSGISSYTEFFRCIHRKVFVLKGLCYFLGASAKLLIFDPDKNQIRLFDGPGLISDQVNKEWGQEIYLLESDDDKLIMVFVGAYGSSVYTFEWNVATSKWEILRSLGNRMLFVSQKLSFCKRATVSGTGNKIYFPRVACDSGQILFYSLATGKYHTFEMATTYSNFFDSKFYPFYNGWFMP